MKWILLLAAWFIVEPAAAQVHLCWISDVLAGGGGAAEIQFTSQARGFGYVRAPGTTQAEWHFTLEGQKVVAEGQPTDVLTLPAGKEAHVSAAHESCEFRWGQQAGRSGLFIDASSSYVAPGTSPQSSTEFIPLDGPAAFRRAIREKPIQGFDLRFEPGGITLPAAERTKLLSALQFVRRQDWCALEVVLLDAWLDPREGSPPAVRELARQRAQYLVGLLERYGVPEKIVRVSTRRLDVRGDSAGRPVGEVDLELVGGNGARPCRHPVSPGGFRLEPDASPGTQPR